MSARAFSRFVDPARARPQIWRLIVGLILSLLVYLVWVVVLFGGALIVSGRGDFDAWAFEMVSGMSPVSLLLLLASFVGMALGPMVAVWLLHKRGARTLFGPRGIVLRDFVLAAGITFGLVLVYLAIWFLASDTLPGLPFGIWIVFLPFALVGLIIQTGAEEILFRGYLQQQLAARFRTPIAWLILPALLFGIVHLDPEGAGESAWIIVAAAALFGLIAADLTAVTGSIGASWGLHFANNCVALLIVATQGSLQGLALRLTPYKTSDIANLGWPILIDAAFLIVVWFIVRRVVSTR